MMALQQSESSAANSDRPVMKRIGPFVWWIVSLICGTPLAIAAIGAVSARPISDDYSLMRKVATEGLAGAFSDYMHNWTPLYSMIGVLAGGHGVAWKELLPSRLLRPPHPDRGRWRCRVANMVVGSVVGTNPGSGSRSLDRDGGVLLFDSLSRSSDPV